MKFEIDKGFPIFRIWFNDNEVQINASNALPAGNFKDIVN